LDGYISAYTRLIMETKDIVALLINVLSVFAAVAAVIIARRAVGSQHHVQGWAVNHALLMRAAEFLVTNPELLQLHGITTENLSQDGISIEEFVYTYMNLDAGAALYKISGDKDVTLTQFRKNFIRNPKVRTMWKKYLRENLFSSTPFSLAVDAYLAEVESAQQCDEPERS